MFDDVRGVREDKEAFNRRFNNQWHRILSSKLVTVIAANSKKNNTILISARHTLETLDRLLLATLRAIHNVTNRPQSALQRGGNALCA